jgi:hypothetical protein
MQIIKIPRNIYLATSMHYKRAENSVLKWMKIKNLGHDVIVAGDFNDDLNNKISLTYHSCIN